MVEDNGSANALSPLNVVNTRGFDLPETGDQGVWMYGLVGVTLMAGALTTMLIAVKKNKKDQPAQQ